MSGIAFATAGQRPPRHFRHGLLAPPGTVSFTLAYVRRCVRGGFMYSSVQR
jgi:hypothetical protein